MQFARGCKRDRLRRTRADVESDRRMQATAQQRRPRPEHREQPVTPRRRAKQADIGDAVLSCERSQIGEIRFEMMAHHDRGVACGQ